MAAEEEKLYCGNGSQPGDHPLGLTAVVELARSLDLMPRRDSPEVKARVQGGVPHLGTCSHRGLTQAA